MTHTLRSIALIALITQTLTACMYYADFDRRRAETENVRQRTASLETYNACLRANVQNPALCPKPAY